VVLILELSPAEEKRLLSGAQIGVGSKWALDLLLKGYEKRQATAATDFCYSIAGMPAVASLGDRIMILKCLHHQCQAEVRMETTTKQAFLT
jgi:hypothetical protein